MKISIEEYRTYREFKPSIFQKIFWILWPTINSEKWKTCQHIKKEDCFNYVDYNKKPEPTPQTSGGKIER